MGSEPEATKRVELSKDQWVELRTARFVSDVRYQREQRHARGDYDDETLDELSLIEARIVGWSFSEKVPSDMTLRRQILDGLEEDDALKLVMANRGLTPKATGTRQRRKKAKAPSPSAEEAVLTNG